MEILGRMLTVGQTVSRAAAEALPSSDAFFRIEWLTHDGQRTFAVRWPAGSTARDLPTHQHRVEAFRTVLLERYQVSSSCDADR